MSLLTQQETVHRWKVLVWPGDDQGEPVLPQEECKLLGWQLLDNRTSTLTTICAGWLPPKSDDTNLGDRNAQILQTYENETGGLRFIGTWSQTEKDEHMTTSGSSPTTIRFMETCIGPWWYHDIGVAGVNPDRCQEQNRQLLLYKPCRSGSMDHYQQQPEWSDVVSWRALTSRLTVAQLRVEEMLHASRRASNDGKLSYSDGSKEKLVSVSESNSPFSRGDQAHPEEAPTEQEENTVDASPEFSSLVVRMCSFLLRNSLLAIHVRDLCFFSGRPKLSFLQVFPLFRCFLGSESLPNDLSATTSFPFEADACGRLKRRRKMFVWKFDRRVRAAADGLIGLVAGYIMFRYSHTFFMSGKSLWRLGHERLLRDRIEWLETFPVGFKLNVPLTQNLGREISTVLLAYDKAVGAMLSGWTELQQEMWLVNIILAGTASIFGLSAATALVLDGILLSTLHLAFLRLCFQQVHRAQLYLLGAIGRLFRGKKYNPLRDRTDTMHHDAMQLILGMILCTIGVFLFTTFLVYHVFFAILYMGVQAMGCSLWLIYVTTTKMPLGELWLRAIHPRWFVVSVYLEDATVSTKASQSQFEGDHQVSRIRCTSQSFGSILWTAISPEILAFLTATPNLFSELLLGQGPSWLPECLGSTKSIMPDDKM